RSGPARRGPRSSAICRGRAVSGPRPARLGAFVPIDDGGMNPRTEGVAIARSSLALVALAWVLPFHWTYRPLPIGSFYSEALAIALGLAALAALLTQPRSSGDGFPMPAAALGLVALAAL